MEKFYSVSGKKQQDTIETESLRCYMMSPGEKMNPFYLIKKEFSAAWNEVNRPLFPESSENESHTELFNFYHSLKGRTIDVRNGESLFEIIERS